MDWVQPFITAMAVAIVGGIVVALVNRVMSRVADDLSEFKEDTRNRFAELSHRQDVHDQFRSEFRAKGWEAMPEAFAPGPGLAVTLTKIDAHLAAIDTKLDTYGHRLADLDRWERRQKWAVHRQQDENDPLRADGD